MTGLRALHSVERWLPRTQPWIYNQLRHLPDDIVSHVGCMDTDNLDAFPWPRIHRLSDHPMLRQLLDRSLRFLGIRSHLGFLRRLVLELEPDLLHSHFGHVGWQNLAAVRGTTTRHVVTFYGQDLSRQPTVRPVWKERYRQLFREADLFLCEGPHMAGQLARLGCPQNRIEVHRLGVDLKAIAFEPRSWQPDEPLRVLMAASFREKKGIPYGIEALVRLGEEIPVQLTVVGDAVDQPGSADEKDRILDRVWNSGLASVSRFPGFLSHRALVAEAYRHHVFLSPSVTARDGDTEGGAPVSLIEMAASGMPIVSTRHCDIPEVVLDGINAELADERDVEGLVVGLRRILDSRDAWPDRLRAGRDLVEQRFDAATQGRILAEHYYRLMGSWGI